MHIVHCNKHKVYIRHVSRITTFYVKKTTFSCSNYWWVFYKEFSPCCVIRWNVDHHKTIMLHACTNYNGWRVSIMILFCVLNLFIKYNGNLCIVNLFKFYCYISNIIFIITTFFCCSTFKWRLLVECLTWVVGQMGDWSKFTMICKYSTCIEHHFHKCCNPIQWTCAPLK